MQKIEYVDLEVRAFNPTIIPALPGLYILHTRLSQVSAFGIGRLGEFEFMPGSYLYIGSARGPGGLRARISRHMRSASSPITHWHIDYLLKSARILGAWFDHNPAQSECEWAGALAGLALQWPESFGASDCGCPGHLLRFTSANPALKAMAIWVQKQPEPRSSSTESND